MSGPGAPGNTPADSLPVDPLPAGQYKLTQELAFSFPGGGDQQLVVQKDQEFTIHANDAGVNGTSTSIGTFGNDPDLTKFFIYPGDHDYFVKTGDPSPEITEDSSGNGVTGGRRKRKQRKTRKIQKQRKTRKQKTNRKSRRASRRN
jgi:hypothetical protein